MDKIQVLEELIDNKAQEFMNSISGLVKLLGGPGVSVATPEGPRTLAEVINSLQEEFQQQYSDIKLTARELDNERIRLVGQVAELTDTKADIEKTLNQFLEVPVTVEGRLQVEEKKLREDISKLDAFLGSDKTSTIDIKILGLLGDQLEAMRMYHDSLGARMVLMGVDTLKE